MKTNSYVKPPQCCGQRAKYYHKSYGHYGWEEGWRCEKCGRIRIDDGTFDEVASAKYHAEMDALRQKALDAEAICDIVLAP